MAPSISAGSGSFGPCWAWGTASAVTFILFMPREVAVGAVKIPCGFHVRPIKEAPETPWKPSTNGKARRIWTAMEDALFLNARPRSTTAIGLVRPYAETLAMVAASTLVGMLVAPRWGNSAVDLL